MAKENERPGFYFLVCPDSELIRQQLDGMLARYPAAEGKWEKKLFWGDEEPVPDFWGSLSLGGLFAGSRAVIVRQAQEWPAAVWKQLSVVLSQKYGNVWPFFCLEVAFEKGKFKIPAHIQKSLCMAYADKNGWVWRNQGLSGATLKGYVEKRAKQLGLVFKNDALSLFCSSAMPDAVFIANELGRLSLVSSDGNIMPEMILTDGGLTESDAFACIRKLETGDAAGVWKEISRDTAGNMLFLLVALLARELRILWQIQAGENPRMYPAEAKFKRNLSELMGYRGISNGFSALAEAEWQVKSGKLPPEQALESLMIKMAKIFANGG